MSTNKRKTLQIKRPDPNSVKNKPKQRPLPKVSVSESAAGATETDELDQAGPKAGTPKSVNEANKGATTRISLPDDAKIRKARRAESPEGEKLPNADQLMEASKNATAQIMIDTEDVQAPQRGLNTDDTDNEADKTMELNTAELNIEDDDDSPTRTSKIDVDDISKLTQEASRVSTQELSGLDDDLPEERDRTMKIDSDALQTGNLEVADLEQMTRDEDEESNDLTMKIDPEALKTGNIEKADLEDADQDEDAGTSDRTMKIDAAALQTGDIGEQLKEADEEDPRQQLQSQETMMMDPVTDETLAEQETPKRVDVPKGEEAFNASTIAMTSDDHLKTDEIEKEKAEGPVDKETMEESFNAQTMAMDHSELERELGKEKANEDDSLDQTMDLTEQRPKTILIKRPSREAPSSSPTVKTVRPDAQTVRTARPVAKSKLSDKQKEGTSRVDVPTTEGKTVKLRRPGASGTRPGAPVSRMASNAGLQMNEDGSVVASAPKKAPTLGAGWMAVSVLTFLLAAGGIYIAAAVEMPDLPMAGRLVDINNNVLPLTQGR